MIEPAMSILISYDKFTQCNKDLAEHHFANFVLKLCNNTSWPSSEFKKSAKATGKWSYAGCTEVFFQRFRWPWIPTNWEISFDDSDILMHFCQSNGAKGIQCRIALCRESVMGTWEIRDSVSYCDYFFRPNYFLVLYLPLLFLFCMCAFSHLPFLSLPWHLTHEVVPMLQDRGSQSLSAGSTSPGSVQCQISPSRAKGK